MNLEDIKVLYAYDTWAHDRVLDAVSVLAPELYEKDLGSSHGGVRGTLVHCQGAYEIWLARWRGENPTTLVKEHECPTFPLLKERWNGFQKDVQRHLDSLTEESIQSPFTYKDMKGNPLTVLLWRQMQHLVNHSSYHRGQVVGMIRQLGGKGVSTDLINYYRQLK